jgi:hypothetical protein
MARGNFVQRGQQVFPPVRATVQRLAGPGQATVARAYRHEMLLVAITRRDEGACGAVATAAEFVQRLIDAAKRGRDERGRR